MLKALPQQRFSQIVTQASIPKIAMTNSQEERIPMKPIQLSAKVGNRRGQISNHPNHEIGGPHNLQQPIVVSPQRACLDSDGAHDA
jgi:hypothetical protein